MKIELRSEEREYLWNAIEMYALCVAEAVQAEWDDGAASSEYIEARQQERDEALSHLRVALGFQE